MNDKMSENTASGFVPDGWKMLEVDREKLEERAYISLWRSVITQALMDAGSESKKTENKRAKHEAISWLLGGGEEFLTVCEMAEMCPDYVMRKAKEAIGRGCVWRKSSSVKARKLTQENTPSLVLETKAANVGRYSISGYAAVQGIHECEEGNMPDVVGALGRVRCKKILDKCDLSR